MIRLYPTCPMCNGTWTETNTFHYDCIQCDMAYQPLWNRLALRNVGCNKGAILWIEKGFDGEPSRRCCYTKDINLYWYSERDGMKLPWLPFNREEINKYLLLL